MRLLDRPSRSRGPLDPIQRGAASVCSDKEARHLLPLHPFSWPHRKVAATRRVWSDVRHLLARYVHIDCALLATDGHSTTEKKFLTLAAAWHAAICFPWFAESILASERRHKTVFLLDSYSPEHSEGIRLQSIQEVISQVNKINHLSVLSSVLSGMVLRIVLI